MKGVLSSNKMFVCSDEEELEEIHEFEEFFDQGSREEQLDHLPKPGAVIDSHEELNPSTPRKNSSQKKENHNSLEPPQNYSRKPSSEVKKANLDEQMEQITPSRTEKIEKVSEEFTPSPPEKLKLKNSKLSSNNSRGRQKIVKKKTFRSTQQSYMDMSYSIGIEE